MRVTEVSAKQLTRVIELIDAKNSGVKIQKENKLLIGLTSFVIAVAIVFVSLVGLAKLSEKTKEGIQRVYIEGIYAK